MSVGLDIGSKTIKVVELVPGGGAFALKGSAILGFAGKSLEGLEDPKEMATLAEAIKKLYREAGISEKDVAVALPESSVFTRTIKFPALTDQEVDSAVKWEAEQYIPIPVNEAIIQYVIIERNEAAPSPYVLVLLVAAPKKLVEKYIAVCELANLSVQGAETELMAMVRALAPTKGVALLLDFGAKSTNIAISKNGLLAFSRSIPTAGEAFSRAVASSLGVSYQQAEEYKKTYGLSAESQEGKIRAALEPLFRVVTDEIKKAIHFYQSEEHGEAATQVIVTGGSSLLHEAISTLSKELGLEVVLGNPFSKVSVDPAVLSKLSAYGPYYSIAVGLALRGAAT